LKKNNQKELVFEEIQEFHGRLVHRLYVVGLVFAPLAFLSLLPQYPETIALHVLLSYASAYLALLFVHLFRASLAYEFRALFLIGIFFATGAFTLLYRGLPGTGIAMLCLTPIISILLLGKKAGAISIITAVVIVALSGALTVNGILASHLEYRAFSTSWVFWLNLLADVALIIAIAATAAGSIDFQLLKSVASLSKRDKELGRATKKLELETAGRAVAEQELLIKNAAVDSTLSAVAICNLDGKLTYANDALVQLWGYKNQNDIIGKSVIEFWADPQAPFQVMEEVTNSGYSRGNMEAQRQDGTAFTAQYTANTIFNEHGQPICQMAIFDDVTDQIRTKAELVNENAWHKVTQEASSTLNERLDFNSSFTAVADALREVVPVDHMMIVLKEDGQAVFEVVETRANESTTIQSKTSVPYAGSFLEYMETELHPFIIEDLNEKRNFPEEKIIHQDGLRSCIRLPLYNSKKFLGMLALSSRQASSFKDSHIQHLESLALQVAHTVSNIQRYQQVRSEAEHLAVIIREVHHRIKNNLQGVIGLFGRHLKEQPELTPIVNAAISQLYSVAEVHNLLTHNTHETVNWHALIQSVCQVTSHLNPHKVAYTLGAGTANLSITASEAVPMALVLNELIQNAINHGYPDGSTGAIRVNAEMTINEEWAKLTVANDGAAPPDIMDNGDHEGFGIGLALVHSLLPAETDFRLFRLQGWTVAEIIIPRQVFVLS